MLCVAISGGAFNPAVGFGPIIMDAVHKGSSSGPTKAPFLFLCNCNLLLHIVSFAVSFAHLSFALFFRALLNVVWLCTGVCNGSILAALGFRITNHHREYRNINLADVVDVHESGDVDPDEAVAAQAGVQSVKLDDPLLSSQHSNHNYNTSATDPGPAASASASS